MATAKVKVYPYVALHNQTGRVTLNVTNSPIPDKVDTNLGVAFLGLPMVEIEVEIPPENALRDAAQKLVDAERQRVNASYDDFLNVNGSKPA